MIATADMTLINIRSGHYYFFTLALWIQLVYKRKIKTLRRTPFLLIPRQIDRSLRGGCGRVLEGPLQLTSTSTCKWLTWLWDRNLLPFHLVQDSACKKWWLIWKIQCSYPMISANIFQKFLDHSKDILLMQFDIFVAKQWIIDV